MNIITNIALSCMTMLRIYYSFFHLCSKWNKIISPKSGDHQHHGYRDNRSSSYLSLNGDADCAVCLGKIFSSSGDTFRVLPTCHHGFHVHCIDAWLNLHSTCPLCRANVPSSHSRSSTDIGLLSRLLSLLSSVGKRIEFSVDDEFAMAVYASLAHLS